MITNSLGGGGKPCELEVQERIRIKPGDRFLLCSDGLSDMLPLKNMVQICRGVREPAAVVQSLILEANNQGGEDNITAVVIDVH